MVIKSLARVQLAFDRMRSDLRSGPRRDRGATAVEYGLIVALIAVVIIVAVVFFGTSISNMFNHSATTIPTAIPGG